MLIDRKIATQKLEESISTYDDWIYIIGNSNIGKSFFVKEISNRYKTIYCEPKHDYNYWRELFRKIKHDAKNILCEAAKSIKISLKEQGYVGDISEQEFERLLETNIGNEVKNETNALAKFLGEYLSKEYNYIVLDNLYKCDAKSYMWLISLLDAFTERDNCNIIVICDTDKTWTYNTLKEDLCGRFTRIDVNKYDDSNAYYDLVKHMLPFNNDQFLIDLSNKLFEVFQGSSQKIYKLINLIKKDDIIYFSDSQKTEYILKKAAILSYETIENLKNSSQEILAILAISPVTLNLKTLAFMMDSTEMLIKEILLDCIKNELVEKRIGEDETEYYITDIFSKEIYISRFTKNQIDFIYQKLFLAAKKKLIKLNPKQILSISLNIIPKDLNDIAYSYFSNEDFFCNDSMAFSELLDKYIDAVNYFPSYLKNMKYINLLYKFGHYKSAYKLIKHIETDEFEYLMKKGDIEHLILHKNTANTFEKASMVSSISISQKLSAINRQIMALTQEDKTQLQNAQKLYRLTIEKYEKYECDGLVELYRNSNNIFEYSTALDYTIKGYKLATKLNNNMERIKTLHNICMLKLLNGNYFEPLNHPNLDVEPNFNMICKEFEKTDCFKHELSYPLLDLGTIEMFKYINGYSENYLINAKRYFSRAQSYARSFYAKNIAETSLLVVNSYMYIKDTEYVKKIRKQLFEKYKTNSNNIKDFRVHRKILLSLAASSAITKSTEEGKEYLLIAKKHMFGKETLRYNNLCDDLNLPELKINYNISNIEGIREYHTTSKFVPWLISFGH